MASLMSHHDDPHTPAEHHQHQEEEEGEICAICLGTLPRWAIEFVRFALACRMYKLIFIIQITLSRVSTLLHTLLYATLRAVEV